MKLSILFLIISLLAIIVVLSSLSWDKKEINSKQIILEIALILFGFSLALIWDNIQDTNKNKKERESLAIILQMELGQMHSTIKDNLETIEANLSAIANKKENIKPILLIDTSAWESAKLRNNVFIKSTGDLFKMQNLYLAVHYANEKIRSRENYRMFNQAMSNYTERLNIIDNDIKQTLEKIQGLHKQAQDFIHAEYPLTIQGYSFNSDKGIIKKEKD